MANTTATKTTANGVSYAQQQLQVGVSLSEGLNQAYDKSKAKVEHVAAQNCNKHSFVLFALSSTLHLAY